MGDLLTRQDLKVLYDFLQEHYSELTNDLKSARLKRAAFRIAKFIEESEKREQDFKLNYRSCDFCRTVSNLTVINGDYLFHISDYQLTYSKCEHCNKMYYHMECVRENNSLLHQLRNTNKPKEYNLPEQIKLNCMYDEEEEIED